MVKLSAQVYGFAELKIYCLEDVLSESFYSPGHPLLFKVIFSPSDDL